MIDKIFFSQKFYLQTNESKLHLNFVYKFQISVKEPDEDREQAVKLKIKYAATLNLGEVIRMVNQQTREAPTSELQVSYYFSFFNI